MQIVSFDGDLIEHIGFLHSFPFFSLFSWLNNFSLFLQQILSSDWSSVADAFYWTFHIISFIVFFKIPFLKIFIFKNLLNVSFCSHSFSDFVELSFLKTATLNSLLVNCKFPCLWVQLLKDYLILWCCHVPLIFHVPWSFMLLSLYMK